MGRWLRIRCRLFKSTVIFTPSDNVTVIWSTSSGHSMIKLEEYSTRIWKNSITEFFGYWLWIRCFTDTRITFSETEIQMISRWCWKYCGFEIDYYSKNFYIYFFGFFTSLILHLIIKWRNEGKPKNLRSVLTSRSSVYKAFMYFFILMIFSTFVEGLSWLNYHKT